MYQILEKRRLSSNVVLLVIDAPYVAKKAEPGQFIILRVDADGERIPLTISAYDREKGTITIVVQEVGATTMKLGQLNEGDCLHDFVGPLGKASEFDGIKKAAVVGGGLGCAIALPQAQKLHDMGVDVDLIAGFRNTDAIILEDEMKGACSRLTLVTDDGSNGHKGFVTDALKELIEAGNKYDIVIAIGPMIMMKFVCKTTEPYGIKTIVSMNTIMVDGTGMCGGCRLTVGGETKFACVDGPDFDGHQVDFDEAMRRSAIYKPQEQAAREHQCNLMKMEVK
ncbi:sulfide/dihydroorotate dehydrogenase-like FAD/NAD-binding protein [Butyricicoccus sp.]|uniref:sulfide/dihydroorotate dehydrogenase-like FAD/NAD-binding protein n=1 Tax=Butyricicoccus sp. TaxID=2049021 RepID=UPI003D7E3509